MTDNIKFCGEAAVVNGVELKRLGNAAFRGDLGVCVGDWPEDDNLNRIFLRSADISEFRDTVELEPGISACTVKTRDGEQHLVFNTAQHHALRYEQVYQEEPDRMMYFHDANGTADMFAKLVSGEVKLNDYSRSVEWRRAGLDLKA